MALLDGQLGKITFIFYPNTKAPGIGIPYVPMYNPTSFSVNHEVNYDTKLKLNTADSAKKFLSVNPRSISMELFFDGTGASPSTLGGYLKDHAINQEVKTVEGQIRTFLKLAYQISGALHKPNYVMVLWGTFVMTGVLQSANVTYTMFAADGSPLRARMSISIKEHIDDSLIGKISSLFSFYLLLIFFWDTLKLCYCFTSPQFITIYSVY